MLKPGRKRLWVREFALAWLYHYVSLCKWHDTATSYGHTICSTLGPWDCITITCRELVTIPKKQARTLLDHGWLLIMMLEESFGLVPSTVGLSLQIFTPESTSVEIHWQCWGGECARNEILCKESQPVKEPAQLLCSLLEMDSGGLGSPVPNPVALNCYDAGYA